MSVIHQTCNKEMIYSWYAPNGVSASEWAAWLGGMKYGSGAKLVNVAEYCSHLGIRSVTG